MTNLGNKREESLFPQDKDALTLKQLEIEIERIKQRHEARPHTSGEKSGSEHVEPAANADAAGN
jgi:hypothetical protein